MYEKLLGKHQEKNTHKVFHHQTGNNALSYCRTNKQQVAFSLVVESVLKKNEHRLEDKRLSRYYPLKVTPYCKNVSSFIIYLVVLPLLR